MTELQGITQALRQLGVDADIVKMVRARTRMGHAPKITTGIMERLRYVAGINGKAVLVLSKKGRYSVFTPEGIAALSANAKKNQPWKSRKSKIVH